MKLKRLGIISCILLGSFSLSRAQEETPDTLLTPGYQELDELVIEAQRPVLQSDGATTTYNVADDPGAAASTALEMLKKVPMVSVDGNGTIRLNGETNFKFKINGQENPMLQQYADKILEGMPAASISKIEVITEPGAKEDAEGSVGVINIITATTAQKQDGYSGNITFRGGARSVGPSLYGILKKDKVTISLNANYMWRYNGDKNQQHSETEYLTGDKGFLISDVEQRSKMQFAGGNLNLSWEPNAKNLFTFGLNLMGFHLNLNSINGTDLRLDQSLNPIWGMSQMGSGRLSMLNLSANASYRHNFSDAKNYLILSYLYNFGRFGINIDRSYRDLEEVSSKSPMGYDSVETDNRNYNRGHTVQADYANDFKSEHHLLEVGAKATLRHNTAHGYEGFNDQPLLEASNLLQLQDVYAAYASYTGSFNPVTILAGVRYEHTLMGIRDYFVQQRDFTNHLNDVVPNAAVTLKMGGMSNLRLAYQMRISRPSLEQVNPFALTISPFEERRGNPDLTSEHNHKVSLTYSAFGRLFGGNIGFEYTIANDAISGFQFLENRDGRDINVTTFANIGRTRQAALIGFLNWNIIHNMSLNLNGRLAYNTLKAPSLGYSNHGWGGNIGGAWNYTVAQVNKFSAYGGWYARNLNVQGYNTGFYYYGVSASRDFLPSKNLTIGISANNFLQKSVKFTSFSKTHESIVTSVGRSFSQWDVALSITWKFGSLKAQVKHTGADINNDDINSSSNNNTGGTSGAGI